MRGKRQENMLDCIPAKNEKIATRLSEGGLVQLLVRQDGMLRKFTRRFVMKIPETTTIDLDCYGSFIWGLIDGRKDIYGIGILLKERFGVDVEPLYERLCRYMKIMENNGFVAFIRR